MDRLIKEWYSGKQKQNWINDKLYQDTFKNLSEGVSSGYTGQYDSNDVRMLLELKQNIAVFSAFKSHAQSLQYFDALIDPETGKKRSWADFRKAALAIDKDYNQNWLEAEYNMAVRQARAAEQWQDFERDKEVYPNLEYMPSRSATPSDAHKPYYGIIRSIDDPIWNTLTPPIRWNCKCWLQQSREDETPGAIEPPAKLPGIEGNSGKTGRIFSPDHPYVELMTDSNKKIVRSEINKLRDLHTEVIRVKQGKQSILIDINADIEDLPDNISFLQQAIKVSGTAQINAHSTKPGQRNPEYTIGKVLGDRWKCGENLRSSINNAFRKAGKSGQLGEQKKCFLAIDFNGNFNSDNAGAAIAQLYSKLTHYDRVSYVLIKNGDKVIKVENKKGLSYQELVKKAKRELLA